MTRKELDARFTSKVKEYLCMGYTIHTQTMGGSQTGEGWTDIARIDLTDGFKIIRVLMETGIHNTVRLTVGKVVAPMWYDTIWNHKLEVLEQEVLYNVSSYRDMWLVSKDEYIAIIGVRSARSSLHNGEGITLVLGEAAKKIVLPFVRRQKGLKSKRIKDILGVYHVTTPDNKARYFVRLEGGRCLNLS